MFGYKIVVQLLSSSIMQLNQTSGMSNDTIDSVEGTFRAIISSKSEGVKFQANLNVGTARKPLVLNAANAFLSFQKGPKLNNPDKLILRYDSNVQNAVTFYLMKTFSLLNQNTKFLSVFNKIVCFYLCTRKLSGR